MSFPEVTRPRTARTPAGALRSQRTRQEAV